MKLLNLLIFVVVFCLVSGCRYKHYDYSVKSLEHEEVPYYRLPEKMKNIIEKLPFSNHLNNGLLNLDSINRYKIETVNTVIGPWISYIKLIDQDTNIIYRIEYNDPQPYIIFKNNLYLPTQYNIENNFDQDSLKFICYRLK